MQLRQCKDKAKKPYTRAFQSCHKGKISRAQDRVEGPWEDRWIATFWMGDHPRWVIALAPKSTAQGRGSRFAGTETGFCVTECSLPLLLPHRIPNKT